MSIRDLNPKGPLFVVLIASQIIILLGTYFFIGTSFIEVFAVFGFVPVTIVCLYSTRKNLVVLSLVLLFVSQTAIFVFLNPSWGINSGHDPINDFIIASVISENEHFTLGQVGYASIQSYSYYPFLHLFSISLSKVTGISLSSVALFIPAIFNAVLVPIFLFHFNHEFFGLEGRGRNIATLLFATNWYYTAFQSSFIRESFAFPFVVLTLLMATRITKRPSVQNVILFLGSFLTVLFSHHVSSYVILFVLAIMAFGYRVFRKNSNLIRLLLIALICHISYNIFVVLDFAITQAMYASEGFLAVFSASSQASVLSHSGYLARILSYSYYLMMGVLCLIGVLYLLRWRKKYPSEVKLLSLFFTFSFIMAVVLRLSTPADAWSWTYYMSLRWTIWSYIGISFMAVLGINRFLNLSFRPSWKVAAFILLIICLLGVGKFSQYPANVSDAEVTPPITYPRYVASLWLKDNVPHGANLLVAYYVTDFEAFEISRSMAPYAYLKEYFIEAKPFDEFSGYIPFVHEYFDRYRNETGIEIVYSNGMVDIGYIGS